MIYLMLKVSRQVQKKKIGIDDGIMIHSVHTTDETDRQLMRKRDKRE